VSRVIAQDKLCRPGKGLGPGFNSGRTALEDTRWLARHSISRAMEKMTQPRSYERLHVDSPIALLRYGQAQCAPPDLSMAGTPDALGRCAPIPGFTAGPP
jgi:hypothetical protein